MAVESLPPPHEIALTNFLIGPFGAGNNPPEKLQDWQLAYHDVALGALKRVAGAESLPADWMPSPGEGAELYRELAYDRKMHTMTHGLRRFVDDYKSGAIATKLRDDQKEMMDTLATTVVEQGATSQITIKAPTAIGKTAVYTTLIAALKYKEQPNEPVTALVLVPTASINDQTVRAFLQFTPIKPGEYHGNRKEIKDVTVMTYQSFENALRNGHITRSVFDVVVRDESDTFARGQTNEAINDFCFDEETGKNKLVFGASATTLEGQELSFKRTLLEGISDGRLSPVMARNIETGIDIAAEPNVDDMHQDYEENPDDILRPLIYHTKRNEIIVSEVVSGLQMGRKVLVRCIAGDNLKHTQILKEMIEAHAEVDIKHPYFDNQTIRRKIRTAIISGDMPLPQRRAILQLYNDPTKDYFDVLLFVDTLTRGFDSPISKKLVNASTPWTQRVAEQALGRVERMFRRKSGRIVTGEIVDLVDNRRTGYTAQDIINRDAPKGMRYKQGAIIGPDLRDVRVPDSEPNSAFEPIPEGERPKPLFKRPLIETVRTPEEQRAAAVVPVGAAALLEAAKPITEAQSLSPSRVPVADAATMAGVSQESLLETASRLHVTLAVYRDPETPEAP
ncbi:MAG TPA: DEAD/DEAH box helicase family protein, partial [Candidatus Saccharimonadales bacterium]|nr:DEAD/DEAH box helicase family protein [Candidatus Saccharimonadales bacterium]